ncbi:MAG: F0F1 ATP synthase subunit epsilon [Planctomycetaceae bacterium]
MAADLQLVLVTPETTLLDKPVQALRFPLFDGQIGILPGRAPLVGRLGYGELSISTAEGSESFFVDGGFVQVKGNTVSLLTNRAIPASEIVASEADELLQEALNSKPRTELEFANRDRDQFRARRMRAMADKA